MPLSPILTSNNPRVNRETTMSSRDNSKGANALRPQELFFTFNGFFRRGWKLILDANSQELYFIFNGFFHRRMKIDFESTANGNIPQRKELQLFFSERKIHLSDCFQLVENIIIRYYYYFIYE